MMKGVLFLQPLQAQAISASSEVCAKLSYICVPIMAVLFVLVLLAFVKDVAGMRAGPTQTASMLETEASLWGKDPCAKFGAKESRRQRNTCQCPTDRPLPRNCEGRSGRSFNRKKTKKGSNCHCEDPCAQFGAKESQRKRNTCQCPKDLPIPSRNCLGTSGRTFGLSENIEFGSDCYCEEKPSCKKFGAKSDEDEPDRDVCYCPDDRPYATKECQRGFSDLFRLSKASKGCRCLSMVEAVELHKMPVAASALRFCDALAAQGYERGTLMHRDVEDRQKEAIFKMEYFIGGTLFKTSVTSPEVCQHALTGTITPTEAEEAPFAAKASKISQHGNDEDRNGDRAYGRMRAVKEDATGSAETALWEDALARVCKDECDDLLKMMEKETKHLAKDIVIDHVPFAQACAERVVQQVEAEVLGCCGRSCGFDGRRCLLWPFFSPQEKVEWEVECCSEMSILKNSSREFMCNSVLPDRLAKEASQYDLNEQAGADIGKVLIGQNSSLVWTKEGAQESALGKEAKAHGGEKVNMEFLLEHKDVGEEYLRLGYFKEKPITKMLDESTSLMEVSSQDATCDFGKFKEKCSEQWMDTYTKRCKEAWMVADEEKRFFRDQVTRGKGGNCSVNDHTEVAAPADCDELATLNQTILLHYFEYNKENSKKPIKCFTLSKEQCKGEAGWWTKIPLKSVQDVIKEEEIKNYTHLVYVKLKAD